MPKSLPSSLPALKGLIRTKYPALEERSKSLSSITALRGLIEKHERELSSALDTASTTLGRPLPSEPPALIPQEEVDEYIVKPANFVPIGLAELD